ncbi:MAG: zinc-ribbon domain-containing protein [Patescibacteria group bacterium]
MTNTEEKKIYCKNCGNENNDNAKFCKSCGGKIVQSELTPKTSEKTPGKKSKKIKSLVGSVIGIVVFIMAFLVARYVVYNGTSAILGGDSKQDIIKESVQEIKAQSTLPQQVDAVTTWTDILAEPNAIRYVYTLHDIDTSQLTNESLKNIIAPNACQTPETRNNLLDQDINMEYSYQVQNSTQTFFFAISKSDCL